MTQTWDKSKMQQALAKLEKEAKKGQELKSTIKPYTRNHFATTKLISVSEQKLKTKPELDEMREMVTPRLMNKNDLTSQFGQSYKNERITKI